jgi:dehydrogenase/reductase SDR family member 7B
MLGYLVLIAIPIILGIFFSGDADFLLYILPKEPVNAFQNQVVWVVGASSGIGAQLAEDFAKSGAQVIISARRVEMLAALASEIAEKFPQAPAVHVLPLDVTARHQHEPTFQLILQKYKKLDVVVLNAGQSQRNQAKDAPFEDTLKVYFFQFFLLLFLFY